MLQFGEIAHKLKEYITVIVLLCMYSLCIISQSMMLRSLVIYPVAVYLTWSICHSVVCVFCSMVAALGLAEDNSVILVASMLISPLMVSTTWFHFVDGM